MKGDERLVVVTDDDRFARCRSHRAPHRSGQQHRQFEVHPHRARLDDPLPLVEMCRMRLAGQLRVFELAGEGVVDRPAANAVVAAGSRIIEGEAGGDGVAVQPAPVGRRFGDESLGARHLQGGAFATAAAFVLAAQKRCEGTARAVVAA